MLRALVAAILVAAVIPSSAAAPVAAAEAGAATIERPLRTALADPGTFVGPQSKLAFRRVRTAGATYVRLFLSWRTVAPRRFPGDRSDPDNPGYLWEAFDAQVRNARAAGLTPIVCLTDAPRWVRDRRAGGAETTWPKIDDLSRFAEAAAWRYSGYYEDVPAARIWQVWNEPNARSNLRPQFRDGQAVAVAHYRRMVNGVAHGVRRVKRSNVVVAGGLSPFGHESQDIEVVAPLRFIRHLLCISRRYRRTCDARVSFDVWAHHPYTSGGPTHEAAARDDVSIGDLPEMRRLVDAAADAGAVRFRRPVEFWVTEFAWDTKPADPLAVPEDLHARWVAEALYRMWQARVSLVTWYLIRDTPLRLTPYQSGLWFEGGSSLVRDRPKRALQAFRFPFVAMRGKGGVVVWGRLPHGRPGRVAIERRIAGWTRLTTIRADRYGIFRTRFDRRTLGPLRAYWLNGSEASLAFVLRAPRDRHVKPFGCGGVVRCKPGESGLPQLPD